MKTLFTVFLFLSALALFGQSDANGKEQKDTKDTPKKEVGKDKKETASEEKESFGDYVQKVGLSIWGRVKERLNLEETISTLEEKKNKLLGDKEEKKEDKKEENAEAPKEVKPEKKSGT